MTALFKMPDICVPPPAMQRARGTGRLAVKHADGAHRLDRLFQEGAARIRLPRVARGAPLEAVLINTAGGLTGGDRMAWQAMLGEGTAASLTTQACEKIYKAVDATPATVSVHLDLAAQAALAWLPQETILFERASLSRHIEVDMAAGVRLLMVEPLVFGRRAMGEAISVVRFQDRWRIRSQGRLIHAEDFAIGPDAAPVLSAPVGLGGATAFATVLLVAPDADRHLEAVRRLIGTTGGASAWRISSSTSGKLLARLSAADSYDLRKILVPLIRLLNPQAGLPKVWSL